MTDSLLTLIIFFPLLVTAVVLFLPNGKDLLIKEIALGATGVQLVLSVILFFSYDGIDILGYIWELSSKKVF